MNRLLEEGFEVKGFSKINGEKEQFLLDFLGRNASFTRIEAVDDNEWNRTKIIVTKTSQPLTHLIEIKKNTKTIHQTTQLIVHFLVGEWMNLDDSGIHTGKHHISYTSDQFNKEAIDIDDFLPVFISLLLKKHDLPPVVNVISNKMATNRTKNLENYLFIRDNRPRHIFVKRLKKHYQRYNRFYHIS
ncbi:MAG TPA: hypothetical protein VIG73_11640 [Cerasibacillus sp.]|uniref:hypothetical protein n=1 Tax=Cerasibacillus sp. TaxID=2498711 RepID=UPI002F41011A